VRSRKPGRPGCWGGTLRGALYREPGNLQVLSSEEAKRGGQSESGLIAGKENGRQAARRENLSCCAIRADNSQ
jgi:hypothetical protein